MSVPRFYTLINGVKIPSLALGCYDIPRGNTAEIVYQALKCGYRHFDTAVLYGNEQEVGDGISRWLKEDPSHKREDVFYTTKLWNSQNGYSPAKKAIVECLNKVKGIGYIDLLLIHSPLSGPQKRLETWKAMQEAVDEGVVKSIGVSNYGKHHIEELLNWDQLKYPPVVNQIEISPWCMRGELTKWCQSKKIVVEAYAPLTHGYKLKDPGLVAVAKQLGRDTGQVLIRWSLQRGLLPLPKTQNPARLATNLQVYDFELSPEQIKEIDHPEAHEPTDWECTDAP
ncbi:related to 2,5-diketo-D-gluconic acid reductase A [Zygosaccharomyces bailii]|uniref:ZYBA0S06-04632g1_1 n=1 Tax=Zygosaccharomyces bailii (strain CLIB 213 / ATCC 58445 / CBS 680 / BCRC 21525 / NBRC 1098 / NCYC 1416 / NRRL Y-2227) TaxID=1333698 RepID=A0A8J2T8R5_ZYGB2|nr:ZYBA0S06-04632g1_1 [Zygosaccharomyces bailii CLIB 213]SJM84635.1 related to 2,5-diketo-D-gluconic acid reductase A [Zygosaccharomyces bailii]